jgi:hypothetical protein
MKPISSLRILAITLGLLSLPASVYAQLDYRGGPLNARQHGYQQGYKDGYAAGRVSNLSNREQDLRNQRLKAQGNGYQASFGSEAEYGAGYRLGFDDGSADVNNGVRSRLDELFRSPAPASNPDRSRLDLSARDHGYQHGYKDGYESGRVSNLSNREQDLRNQRLKAQGNGYEPSFGSEAEYSQGYRQGFDDGSKDVSNGVRSRLEELFRSPDPGYRDNRWSLEHVAADIGYRDGVSAGSQDRRQRRWFQPRQSAAWKNGLRGYDAAMGSRTAYRAAYRIAFEDGYQDGFGASR